MKILGVTGCPTGIAHTFMAEKALKEAAKELGCEIKVETNGAIGVENALTAKDIQEADAIIVACDKNVDMERFNGRPVIDVSVTEGINHAKELIQKCIDKKVPIRKGNVKISNYNQEEKVSFGRQIYKHLMNGVSHMLPLVVAGGVLTAISFLWGIYSFDPTSPQYNVIAATIKEVGGYSMNLMVPVLTAFIAQSIAGRPGMLAGFVAGMIASATGSGFIGGIIGGFAGGYFTQFVVNLLRNLPRQLEGLKSIFIVPIITVLVVGVGMILLGGPCSMLNESMMSFLEGMQKSSPVILGLIIGCMSAFDMGGPVNKAAYVTGTMLLAQGNYLFMAGVSAACITPPLIIALAATFKKDRFTEEDRTAGLINYVLGCTHITEGAIPFAAKNPLKVIPVLMAGSSISAIATYIMKVEVPAPHGGFLILGLVNKPLIWITCILLGSAIGAVLYVLVTPKVEVAIDGQDVTESGIEIVNKSNLTTKVGIGLNTNDLDNVKAQLDAMNANGWKVYIKVSGVDASSTNPYADWTEINSAFVDGGTDTICQIASVKPGDSNPILQMRVELPLLTQNDQQKKSTGEGLTGGLSDFDIANMFEIVATQENNPGWNQLGSSDRPIETNTPATK